MALLCPPPRNKQGTVQEAEKDPGQHQDKHIKHIQLSVYQSHSSFQRKERGRGEQETRRKEEGRNTVRKEHGNARVPSTNSLAGAFDKILVIS